MAKFFIISAVSKKRHLELVSEKSDIYDSAETYGLNYQEKFLEGNGTADSPFKIEVNIQNTSDKIFEGIIRLELEANGQANYYLPGFMYNTNRGDKPWKVDCKFPRLNSSVANPSDSDCPLSSFYMVRADRLSHPCALMYVTNGRSSIRGFHTSPYYCEKDFIQYNGFTCNSKRQTVGYTFGYENAPWLFVQSHTILPRQTSGNYFTIKPDQKITQIFYIYDYETSSLTDIHKVIKNVYDAYHEKPKTSVSVDEAIKDLSLAVCNYAWLPSKKYFSGFVREDGLTEKGQEKFSYNEIPSISWTNGIVVAYPQLIAAARLKNQKMREQALICIQNIVDNSLNKSSSLPYETFDGQNWNCHGWWYGGMHSGGHSAYLDGQFIYYLLKAYQFEKDKGIIHEDWLTFSKTVVSALEQEISRSGAYPFIYSETDGTGIEYDSLGSVWALTASLQLALITNDSKRLALFEKSLTHYYKNFIAKLECYGSPLDTDKAPDNEGVLAFIRAAKLLHQITENPLYLDYMETALYQEFSYKFCYNGRIEVPPLSTLNWSSCGGSITSVCNPHIHPMSSSIIGEMFYFVEHAKKDTHTLEYIKSRIQDTILWGCQTYNHFDGEFGYGKKGWMSERFCYSQGLVVEKYKDGTPSSTWFALMPWASSSVLEGLLDAPQKKGLF